MSHNSKIQPKLPINEIHKDIKKHFKGFKYLVMATNDESEELYTMTSYDKEGAIEVLTSLLNALTNGGYTSSHINSRHLKNLKKDEEI